MNACPETVMRRRREWGDSGNETVDMEASGRSSLDLRIVSCVGINALGHGEPPDDAFAVSCAMTADKITIGVIDDGLYAQDASELVVHIDPVASDAMLDAHAFDPRLEVAGHLLAREADQSPRSEAQEAHLIGSRYRGCRGCRPRKRMRMPLS